MKKNNGRESEKSREREKVQNPMHTNGMLTRYVCRTMVCVPSLVNACDDDVGTCVFRAYVYACKLPEKPTPASRDVPPGSFPPSKQIYRSIIDFAYDWKHLHDVGIYSR